MRNLVRRCVYTLHFVAASIVGGLLLPVVSAAALAVALVRGPKGHAAVFAARTYSRVMQRVLGWKIEAVRVRRYGYDRFAANLAARLRLGETGFRLLRAGMIALRPLREIELVARR